MSTINPYVRFSMYDTIDKKWCVYRAIWDYEVIYIDEGEMTVTVNNTTYVAGVGDIIFLRPYETHILRSNSDILSQPHVHFDLFKDDLSEIIPVSLKRKKFMNEQEKTWFRHDDLKTLNLDFPTVLHLHDHLTVKNILLKIIDEYRLKLPSYEMYLSALMSEMLVIIQRSYSIYKLDLRKEHALLFEKLKRYVLDNIDRNIKIEELATFTYMSKYYFIKVFTEHFNTTPHKYITRLRVQRAQELIVFDKTLSISDIASKMNFDSQQTFSMWFRKNTGYNPSEYRKMHE